MASIKFEVKSEGGEKTSNVEALKSDMKDAFMPRTALNEFDGPIKREPIEEVSTAFSLDDNSTNGGRELQTCRLCKKIFPRLHTYVSSDDGALRDCCLVCSKVKYLSSLAVSSETGSQEVPEQGFIELTTGTNTNGTQTIQNSAVDAADSYEEIQIKAEEYKCSVCSQLFTNLDSHMCVPEDGSAYQSCDVKSELQNSPLYIQVTKIIKTDEMFGKEIDTTSCDVLNDTESYKSNSSQPDCVLESKDIASVSESQSDKEVTVNASADVVQYETKDPATSFGYECDVCKQVFPDVTLLKAHRMKHSVERPFECHVCKKSFKLNRELQKHIFEHASLQLYDCKICKQSFPDYLSLTTHSATSHDETSLPQTSYKRKPKVTVVTQPEKKFKCEYCDKAFSDEYVLLRHSNLHDSPRPFECDVCEKKFARYKSLKEHLREHSKKRKT